MTVFVLTLDHLIVKVSVFPDVSFSSRDKIDGGLAAVDDCFVDCFAGFVVVFAGGLELGFADSPVLGSL